MAVVGTKISELPAPTRAFDGTELVEVVQDGVNAKATLSNVIGFNVRTPRKALLFGTSLSLNCSFNLVGQGGYLVGGHFTCLNEMWGQRLYLPLSLNKGVNGDTTNQMAARFAADVAANYANFDIAFVEGGINDPNNSITPLQSFNNLVTFCTALLNAGKWVVLYTIPPVATPSVRTVAQYNNLMQLNIMLRQWAAAIVPNAPFYLIDPYPDLVDPQSASGQPASGTTPDGLHPSAYGARMWAKKAFETLGAVIPPVLTSLGGPAEVYDASNNIYGNISPNPGFLTQSGGTAGTGIGGQIVSLWTAQRLSGTLAATEVIGSVVQTQARYAAVSGNKQRFSVQIAPTKSTAEAFKFAATSLINTGLVTGDIFVASCRVDITGGLALLYQAQLTLESYNSGFSINYASSDGGGAGAGNFYDPGPQTLFLKTPPYQITASDAYVLPGINFYFDVSGTDYAIGTIDISGMAIEKVKQ